MLELLLLGFFNIRYGNILKIANQGVSQGQKKLMEHLIVNLVYTFMLCDSIIERTMLTIL